jgi:hypothetical protein
VTFSSHRLFFQPAATMPNTTDEKDNSRRFAPVLSSFTPRSKNAPLSTHPDTVGEFFGGTSPAVPATPAERAAASLGAGYQESGSARYLTVDMTLDRHAVFSRINGEMSPALQAPWSPVAPAGSEVIGTAAIGQDRVRFRFPAPDGSTEQYLRIQLKP